MVKLFGVLGLVVLTAVLTGLNLENKVDIWFFHKFKEVPVFFALLIAFIAGIIASLPFKFKSGSDESRTPPLKKRGKQENQGPVDYDA